MNTKSRLFGLVIEKYDKENEYIVTLENINNYLNECDFIDYSCYILHDKDVNDNGERKHEHYHLILRCVNAYSKETILNDVAKHLVKNKNTVSVRALNNFNESVRYLTHKGIEGKVEYSIDELHTNDKQLTKEIYENPIDENNLSITTIKEICERCDSITDVYMVVGIKNAKNYRNVIKDIYENMKRRL